MRQKCAAVSTLLDEPQLTDWEPPGRGGNWKIDIASQFTSAGGNASASSSSTWYEADDGTRQTRRRDPSEWEHTHERQDVRAREL